jgi:cytochrome c-type biogenesis protein CcmH/NrfF
MDMTATFLAGAILSWALPITLLIIVTIWWVWLVRGRSREES